MFFFLIRMFGYDPKVFFCAMFLSYCLNNAMWINIKIASNKQNYSNTETFPPVPVQFSTIWFPFCVLYWEPKFQSNLALQPFFPRQTKMDGGCKKNVNSTCITSSCQNPHASNNPSVVKNWPVLLVSFFVVAGKDRKVLSWWW